VVKLPLLPVVQKIVAAEARLQLGEQGPESKLLREQR
jgi:hypothetical protein